MELTTKQNQAQDIVRSIVTKCWEDASFKQELVNSPVQTLEKYSDGKLSLPAGKQLVVVDQTDSSKLYLNIHAKPDFDNLELSDEQLEMVAGGEFVVGGTIIGIAVGSALLGAGIWVGKNWL